MLPDTLTINATDTSTQPQIYLLPTTAKQGIVVFISNQNKMNVWSQLLSLETYSARLSIARHSEAYQTMLASEDVLRRDWEQPEENAAWANL